LNTPHPKHFPIFFILGRPRSGTTLIRTLFDAHPNVKIPPEFPLILLFYRKFKHVKNWDEPQIRVFVDEFFRFPGFGHRKTEHLKIDQNQFLTHLLELPRPVTIADLLLQINLHCYSPFPKKEILWAGDKNPIYSIFVPFLRKLYPEAKFICLVRDYRDTFLSLRSLKEAPIEAPVLTLQVARWRYVTRRFIRYHREDPGHFLLIRYEDFVRDPEGGLMEFTTFLRIPYEPSALDFHRDADGLRNTFSVRTVEKFHRSLLSPVNTDKIGLWQKEMTPAEIRKADLIAGKTGTAMGYTQNKPGFHSWLWLSTRGMVAYGWLLFSLMRLSPFVPYGVARWLSGGIVKLVRIHTILQRKRKVI